MCAGSRGGRWLGGGQHRQEGAGSRARTGSALQQTVASQRVEYELSDLATTLIPHAVALANWAVEHSPDVDAHRAAYDSRRGT